MEQIKSKWRLFRFEDGTIVDISKIDFVAKDPKNDNKYIVQISGNRIGLDIDDESDRLIKTWDLYIKNEEQNAEYTYLHEKEMSTIVSILNKKLDFVLAAYTKVHKDEVPEYPLGDVKDDWSPDFKRS
jgi:hypothetical protein